MKFLRRRSTWILLALFLLPVLASGIWYARQVRQQRLDHALIEAIKKEDTPAAIALLDQRADPNAAEPFPEPDDMPFWKRFLPHERPPGTPALILALRNREVKSVEALLKQGACPDVQDGGFGPDADTALTLAVGASPYQEQMVALLLAHGAKINATNGYGRTALITAAERNDLPLVRLLLEHGADPDAIIGHYHPPLTPLICAIQNRNTAMVETLLKKGAHPNLPYRNMPSLLAMAKGDIPVTALLKQAGAK